MFEAYIPREAGPKTTKRLEPKSLLMARTVAHVTFLAHHIYAMYAVAIIDYKKFNDPRLLEHEYLAPRYLTGWNMVMQGVFLILALLYDIHLWRDVFRQDVAKYIWQTRDFLLTALVGPCTLFVFGLFWILYSINRDLVLPPYVDVICTPMLNHSLHSVIMLVLMAEIMLQPKLKPKSDYLHYKTLVVFYVVYFGVFFAAYYESGLWVYPFFNHMNPLQIFLTLCGVFTSMFVLYKVQWFLSGLFWNTSNKSLLKKMK